MDVKYGTDLALERAADKILDADESYREARIQQETNRIAHNRSRRKRTKRKFRVSWERPEYIEDEKVTYYYINTQEPHSRAKRR